LARLSGTRLVMTNRIPCLLLAAAVAALGMAPPPARADLAIELISNGTDLIIHDNLTGDINNTLGAINIQPGTVVGNYTITSAAATGFPFLGSPINPNIDLNSLDVTNTGAPGTLTIRVSETGFTPSAGSMLFLGAIGGTQQTQTFAYSGFLDPTNTLFGTSSQIGVAALIFTNPSPGAGSTSSFSGSISSTLNPTNPYSLTEQVVITGTAQGEQVSYDANLIGRPVVVTPLPAALPLFATGLAALGLLGWRRKRKAAA